MSDHEKRHLSRGIELSRTRYVGFNKEPVQDDSKADIVNSLPSPALKRYYLLDGHRWIDAEKK